VTTPPTGARVTTAPLSGSLGEGEAMRGPAASPEPPPGERSKSPTQPPRVPIRAFEETPPAKPQPSLTERFTAWRDRMKQPPVEEPSPSSWVDALATWRDELVSWMRLIAAGQGERQAPAAPPIETMAARFALPELAPVFALLYAGHLAGQRGCAPVDVARVLGRRWDEALGRGQLAARKVAHYRESRVELAAGVLRALDELPPATGILVGTPGDVVLLSPCVVVAAERPMRSVAESCLANVGGAILASNGADRDELFVEARAFGAVPMLRLDTSELDRIPTEPSILLVDAEVADALDLPRLG
jgi:hypothetical protein